MNATNTLQSKRQNAASEHDKEKSAAQVAALLVKRSAGEKLSPSDFGRLGAFAAKTATGKTPSTDAELEALRNWPPQIVRQCRPDWFKQSCAAYRRLVQDRRFPTKTLSGCVHLYVTVQEFAMINVKGSDQSGGWEISQRKLAKFIRKKEEQVKDWTELLVKNGYFLLEQISSKSGFSSFKVYIAAVLTDERIAQLEGRSPTPLKGVRTDPLNGVGSIPLNGVGSIPLNGVGSTPVKGAVAAPLNGGLLVSQGRREKGEGVGEGSPPGIKIAESNILPTFPPIQPGTFASTLRQMQSVCNQKIREIQKAYQESRRVFTRQAHYDWFLTEAKRFTARNAVGKDRKAEYLAKAEALHKDQSNWKEVKVLSELGVQHVAAWKAHLEEINKALPSAR